MKTTLFLIGLLLTCNFIKAQTTAIPDTNFEQSLVNQGIDTNGMTGDILNADANSVTLLNVSFANISDLTGIEAFVSLQYFYCDNNALTSLDMSSNTALEILYCGVNSLTSLNITNNTALTYLSCGENFSLSSLDVSQNPNLTDLAMNLNVSITSLDVSNNLALKFLNVWLVPLGTIDISQNVALEQLNCQSTNISTLDVSQNPALWNLDARGNSLINLDLSNNPAMFIMYLSGNSLTSLDVANGNNSNVPNANFTTVNNPGLTCINVDDKSYSDSNWTNIDAGTNFSENCALSTLDLDPEKIKIHPNPISDYLIININEEYNYAIYNINGQRIRVGKLEYGRNILDLDDLSKGIYILNIENESSDISKKLVKL